MNYLAHLYLAAVPADLSKRQASLADVSDESLVGSLLGDFVKGDGDNKYSTGIRRAILIHRRVDAYSNAHPVYRRSRHRIHSSYRHTRGILVDLFYDHFLARDCVLFFQNGSGFRVPPLLHEDFMLFPLVLSNLCSEK
ncbi:Acyl carrier protein phosphodiesterase [subsurface metagenome]